MKHRLVLIAVILWLMASAGAAAPAIEVTRGDDYRLEIPGVLRYFLLSDYAADVARSATADELVIRGKHVGQTILHVWDAQGRKSYAISVREPSERRANKATAEPGLKLGLSTGLSGGKANSKFKGNRFEYLSTYYVFDTYGNTPFGYMNGQVAYKARSDDESTVRDLSSLKLSFKQEGAQYTFGDQYIYISDYILPSQQTQGLSYAGKLRGADVLLSYGVNHNGWWGSDIFRDVRVRQEFLGGSVTVPFGRTLRLGLHSIMMREAGEQDTVLTGLSGTYYVTPRIKTFMEYATDFDKRAAKAGVGYDGQKFDATVTYRDSSRDYRTAAGYVSWGGEKGWYLSSQYRPGKALSFSTYYNRYIDKVYDPDYVNKDGSATTYLTLGKTKLSYNFWVRDRGGYYGAAFGNGHNLQASYILSDAKSSVYYRYSPSRYDRRDSNTYDYDQYAQIVGVQTSFLTYASLTLEHQWNRTSYAEREASAPRYLRAYVSVPSIRIGRSPFYLSGYIRYQDEYEKGNDLLQNSNYARVRADWKYSEDMKAYLEYSISAIDARDSIQLDRATNELKFGTTIFFDTGYRYTGRHNVISGFVFMDSNGNGELDADENGLGGIRVRLANGMTTVTDDSGRYRFDDVQDASASVEIDRTTLPKDSLFTTPAKHTFGLGYSDEVMVSFGISTRAVVHGLVFYDANGNREYDPGERMVEGVRISLGDGSWKTSDSTGFYKFDAVTEGYHDLEVDINTLPIEFVPGIPVHQRITVMGGKKNRFDIPLSLND